MQKFQSNDEFYCFLDEVIKELQSIGLDTQAISIHCLIHDVAWTSTSELFPEIQEAAENIIKNSYDKLTKQMQLNLELIVDTMKNAMYRANNPNG